MEEESRSNPETKPDNKQAILKKELEEGKVSPPWKQTRTTSAKYWDNDYTFCALVGSLQRYQRFRPASPFYYDVVAAWALATWLIEEWRAFGPLYLLGPIGSGKTTLLEWLEETAYHAIRGGSMSTSVMFHLSDDNPGSTMLIDESQILKAEEMYEAQALVNESYRVGGKVWRMTGEGRNMRPRAFQVFGPKAFAGTQPPWEALTSRAVLIHTEYSEDELEETLTSDFFEEMDQLRFHLAEYRERFQSGVLGDQSQHLAEVKMLLRSKVKNPRVREVGFPLLMVAPEGEPRENILKYLGDLETDHRAQEQTGYLAEYVRGLLNLTPENGRVSARMIREWFRVEWQVKAEKLPSSRTIMAALDTLGFHRTRMTNGSAGVFWDEELVKRLQAKYSPPGQTSETSETSAHEGKKPSRTEDTEDTEGSLGTWTENPPLLHPEVPRN